MRGTSFTEEGDVQKSLWDQILDIVTSWVKSWSWCNARPADSLYKVIWSTSSFPPEEVQLFRPTLLLFSTRGRLNYLIKPMILQLAHIVNILVSSDWCLIWGYTLLNSSNLLNHFIHSSCSPCSWCCSRCCMEIVVISLGLTENCRNLH